MIQTIKQNKKAVLAFLLALVMLIGLIPFTTTEVQALNTISTGDTFEHGDQINVYCVGSDKSVIYTASVSEGVTTWTSDEKLFFAPGNTTIIACYPLRTHLSRVSLPLDQSTEAKVKSADHMTALSSDTLPSEPVDLHFKHLMAKITVKYKLDTEFDVGTPIAKAEIYSRYTEFHTFSPAGGDFRKSLTPNWITSWINGNEFTAIVSPDAYSAGDDFIRVTIGDQVLTAKMKEDITFEEGTHYTFDLTVGKDKVTVEQVSVNGNDPSIPFGDGWRSDTEEDLGAVSITDTQDEGKTAWYDGDQIIATLTSQYYGKQTAMLTFSGSDGTWSTDESFSYLENETPTVKAVYAPSNILGTGEYIEFDCELNGTELTVKLESAKRNYSRLRIMGLPNQTLTVYTTKFTPAGATSAATAPYTLTADEKGNAYLYGTFAEGATVSVTQGDVVLKEYAFTAEKLPGGTQPGKSYALFAGETVDVNLADLTSIYVINDSKWYHFTGSGSYGIKVESGNPTIVLNDASITVGEGSAIDVASGSNATIFVLGENTIGTTKTESWNKPCGGIFVAEGGTVNITSNSTANILRAHGTLAAAIGGKYDYDNNESYNAGNINISNVTVYAYTNNFYAAAIGAAGEGTCGTINITNAVVYVYGAGDKWTSAPGIGNAWSLLDWSDTIPIVIISDSEVHTFRYNPYSDYIGYLGDESGDTYATGSINCGDGGSVKNSTIYCYTGLDATTTDKVVTYNANGTATEN